MENTIQAKRARLQELKEKYATYKRNPFKLNLKRGVPGKDQLALSEPMLSILTPEDLVSEDGTDLRNYGDLTGLKEAKELFAEIFDIHPNEVIVGGNSSLQLMYSVLANKLFLGQPNRESAWSKEEKVKFLCPSPGYDRHFNVVDQLGFELIPVEMTKDGPDMEQVEQLVANDASIKGIWCVPKYSNPTGITYSDDVVDRLAKMKTAAKDFVVMWDNAYVVHHLQQKQDQLKNFLEVSKQYQTEERVWMFSSTSKMTFPGSGVAAIGTCEENVKWYTKILSNQTIGYDKLNQKRHVKFLKNKEHLLNHMQKHAAILKPKFDQITKAFSTYFKDSNMVEWTEPNGGYFIHLTTNHNCATTIVDALAEVGISLTEANAAYPYGENPNDNSIRLAPTPVPTEDLDIAVDAICLCIEMVTLEKELAENNHKE